MIGPATLNQSLVLKHMWCHRHKWGFWKKNKTTRKLKQGTKPKNQVQHCACQMHCRAQAPAAGAMTENTKK